MLTTRRMVVYLLIVFLVAFIVSAVVLLFVYKPWVKKEEPERAMWLLDRDHPTNIKIITRDLADNTKTKENDTTQYDVNKYDTSENFLSYEYDFKRDSQCIQITFDGKEVWNYDSTGSEVGYPKTVLFNMNEKTAFFEFPEYFYDYKYKDDGWREEFKTRRIGFVELETSLQYNTNQVDFKKDGGEEIFTPKLGYFIISVKHGGKNVWSTNRPKEAAKMVTVKLLNNYMKVIVVHSVNGKVSIFYTSKKK